MIGLLFNKGGLWIGAHYSPFNRRWCINVLPCVTLWIALPGGKAPNRTMAAQTVVNMSDRLDADGQPLVHVDVYERTIAGDLKLTAQRDVLLDFVNKIKASLKDEIKTSGRSWNLGTPKRSPKDDQ